MARIITKNKNILQSYIFTAAKYDFTAYEKRIMYRLVECAQKEIEGIKIKDNMHKIQPVQLGREITLPTSSILRDEKDENYTIAKKAFLSLSKKHIIYEDEDYWMATPIITKPKISKKEGTVTFLVFDEIWKCILDFTKGYRKYELITAMQFKSVYAMRFYELMAGQTKPLFVPLEGSDGLRERFGLQKKYKLTADFRRYVLDAAKKELDESSPYSFVANLVATPTGVELIQIIHEELLKSAELTGIWEKKLREIERKTYNASQFLDELKQMVTEVVMSVLSDNSNRHITIQLPQVEKKTEASSAESGKEVKKRAPRKKPSPKSTVKTPSKEAAPSTAEKVSAAEELEGSICPLCGKGTVIKGKTAYGCSEWKNGCTYRKPFGSHL